MSGELADEEPLRVASVRLDPRDLTLLEVNARYMRQETFQRLTENIRRDGACTQSVLVYVDPDTEQRIVLSGNHRVQACIAAEVFEIPAELIEGVRLSRQRQIALQLSHNAISGEDDPATLKQLYEQLGDPDLRDYSGLDDATLGLLAKIELAPFSEANLDFSTVSIVFLPHELDRARAAFLDARKLVNSDEVWLARYDQHEQTLDALQTAHSAWKVGNVATALCLILDVFDANLDKSVRDAWYDPETGARREGLVPIESALGTRVMPADAAAVVARAVDAAVARGDVEPGRGWRWLELVAADYLAGA